MKRKSIFLIMVINFLFFINVSNVSAITCADIEKEVNDYDATITEIGNLDCTKDTDSNIVKNCNKLNLQKSQLITKLYRYSENYPTCKTAKTKIDKIIEENKNNCSLISNGFIENITKYFMTIFYILGPILTIIFGTLDYTKAIVINDPEALKKATRNFTKRLISVVLLFLAPYIVNLIISFNQSGTILQGDSYVCGTNYINLKKNYTIKYVEKPKTISGTGNSVTTSGLISGDYSGYMIRISAPTRADKFYNFNEKNTGQCVWYVRNRSKELLSMVNMKNETVRKKAIDAVSHTYGNAKDWWNNSGLKIFGKSTDVTKPKVGSIVVFGACAGHQYGHVAMIEKVYKDSSGKVYAVDYTEGWAKGGNSCPGSGECVQFKYRKEVPLANIKKNYSGEPFLGYVYLLD